MSGLEQLIDHTLLAADATPQKIQKLCQEAREYGFATVCIPLCFVELAARELAGSAVKVCTVVGFPLGHGPTPIKVRETELAVELGADEIDMVLSISALKAGDDEQVYTDILAVVSAAQGRGVKVILETALLNQDEKIRACQLAERAGAQFVKTSTGFGPSGASLEDVALMRKSVSKKMGVKASGGVRDYLLASKMVEAGANRIGTSSGPIIVEQQRSALGETYKK